MAISLCKVCFVAHFVTKATVKVNKCQILTLSFHLISLVERNEFSKITGPFFLAVVKFKRNWFVDICNENELIF